MLDAAQIFRQTINTTQFTAQVDSLPKDVPAQTGSAMGFSAVVDVDPTAELMDSMEELSFQFEEKEAKNVSERKLGETKSSQNAYVKAIEEWMKLMPDMPDSAFIARLLRQCRQAVPMPNATELLKWLAQPGGSEDPSHQAAMLDLLDKLAGEGDKELTRLFADARQTLERTKGAEMRAGFNLAEAVNSRATNAAEMQDLRQLYRGTVIGFTTPQQCFKELLSTRGPGALAKALEFLIEGAGADLGSPSPSQSTEELRRVILDLQCVQVLKTVLDKMDGLAARMLKEFQNPCLMNGEKMTGKIVDFTEEPFMSRETIASFVKGCGIEKLMARLDFLTQLTIIFRQLSPRLVSSEKDRFRMIDSAQEELDEVVDESEIEKAKREKNKEGGKK